MKRSLYNLESDPSETTNIIEKHPERAAEMEQQLSVMMEARGLRSLQ